MEKSKIEHYVWADKVADQLKEMKVKKHVIHGMWTPSGFFHIGNARPELMVPSLINSSLKNQGLISKQNFIIDDFDDFDKVPAGLDIKKEDFEEHLGKPLREVPSPVEGFESWAHYFQKDVLDCLDKFGIKANVISSYDSYKNGLFDEAIKIVLNKAEDIRKIWNDVTNAKKQKGWLPVMVVCENCGKSATTKVVSWDGKEVEYACNQNVDYTKGCKHKGKLKPEKGKAKLPWRLHWAAGWFIYGTSFESGGKDHFSSGGSVQTSQAFCKEIFKAQPPLQTPTEFLLVDNTKLSGSAGNVISLKDWLEFAEPELLRFMMASYKQNTVINFDLHSNKFFLLADRYEKAEQSYFEKEGKKEKRDLQLTEIYKYSQIKEIPEKIPVQLNYSIATMIAQTFPNKTLNELIQILHSHGWIHRKTLSSYDKERLTKRLELSKNWLEKYAPEDVKFTVQEEVPKDLKLNAEEKKALGLVVKALKQKRWTEKTLFEEFYDICEKTDIKNTDFFRAAYNVLLNKDRGPKLAPFILTLGKEKVIELFEKI
ncbi:lysine--tRNA ligase [Candidatus Woesearchaeota archaeon]|nr:lysine--tRNA ligase [Candidatus Woesearchaeota archaeon]|tara:strand:- start:1105 stop:2724 length:1620 start_codon:yes stop_codon:yes gene_type:complete